MWTQTGQGALTQKVLHVSSSLQLKRLFPRNWPLRARFFLAWQGTVLSHTLLDHSKAPCHQPSSAPLAGLQTIMKRHLPQRWFHVLLSSANLLGSNTLTPHLVLGTGQNFLPVSPALGNDIKIALSKGWLSPQRTDPKATRKNQGVVGSPKLAFQLQAVMETWLPRCFSFSQVGCPCDSKWTL